MSLSKFDEAHVYLDAALANNPNDFLLHIAKAGIYQAKGRPDLALKCKMGKKIDFQKIRFQF